MITAEQFYTFLIVLAAICSGVIALDKIMDIIKKWKAPTETTARKLETDKRRLDEHDEAIKKQQESSKVVMMGVLALLDHELHNGNADQMQQARDNIMIYLTEKI